MAKLNYSVRVSRDGAGFPVAAADWARTTDLEIVGESIAIAANTANHSIDVAAAVAELKAVAMMASTDCTVRTNSTSSPDQTLALKAGIPGVLWEAGMATPCPITADLSRLYVTNGPAETVFTVVLQKAA